MNEKGKAILFQVACVLILIGTATHFSGWAAAPYLFAVGAAGYALTYLTVSVKELDFRSRRLHRFNVMAGLLMIFGSALMFKGGNEWIVCLTIATFLQTYTVFVSPKGRD